MQIHLRFKGENVCLPMAYRQLVQGMLYRTLERVDPACSAGVHDGGRKLGTRQFKLFTFGPLTGAYTAAGGNICFSEQVFLEIRSAEPVLIQNLLRGLAPGEAVTLGNNRLTVEECRLEHQTIFQNKIRVRTVSPIVAYVTLPDRSTRFFSPEEGEFYSLLQTNAARKWGSVYGQDAPFSLSIAPVEGCTFRKQVTKFKTTRINAWFGSFALTGEPSVLNFLYDTGLGAKNSQGFGMFRMTDR